MFLATGRASFVRRGALRGRGVKGEARGRLFRGASALGRTLHYLVWLSDPADADAVIAMKHAGQAFMFEMSPTSPGWDAAAMKALITTKLHPAGVRAFTSTPIHNPTAEDHQALFDSGFDVVMTYDLATGMKVREAVNESRGVSPP